MEKSKSKNGKNRSNQTEQSKRKRKILIAILLAIIIIITGSFVAHHAPPEGASRGTLIKVVLDQDNNPVEGVTVKVANDSCGNTVIATKTTDNQGKACFNNLVYGTYYVNVSYTFNGKIYYGDSDSWEMVIIDSSLIQVTNFLRDFPENAFPRGGN